MLGVDITVSQTDYILTLIEQAIPDQPFIHLVNLIHEDMAIVDAKVVSGSKIANRKIGDLPVPVSLVRLQLQSKLREPENREKMKLPSYVADLRVENGQLVVLEK